MEVKFVQDFCFRNGPLYSVWGCVSVNMNIKVNDKHANYYTTNYYICFTVLYLTLKINDIYKRNL